MGEGIDDGGMCTSWVGTDNGVRVEILEVSFGLLSQFVIVITLLECLCSPSSSTNMRFASSVQLLHFLEKRGKWDVNSAPGPSPVQVAKRQKLINLYFVNPARIPHIGDSVTRGDSQGTKGKR